MSLSQDDLSKYVYNPQLMQKTILEMLDDDEKAISDPTNPFIMLMEAACVTSSSAALECQSITRKKYPSLANNDDDLFHHLNDNLLENIFATPADVEVDFYVNVTDLQGEGYRPDDALYVQTTIPKYTVITILEVPLTMLNDIVVRLYDNGNCYVEQQLNSDNDLAYTDVSIIKSEIISSSDGTPYIKFTTKVKQLKLTTSKKTITVSTGFSTTVTIDDKYCYSRVMYKNNNTNNSWVEMDIYHNDEYINPLSPGAYVSPYQPDILVRIPDVYLVEGLVSGTVKIEIYSTQGELYLPINRYSASDFSITYGETSQDTSSSTISNIATICNSTSIINGGIDSYTTDELKNLIINQTNSKTTPITELEVKRQLELNGYSLVNYSDTITKRVYLALKSLPDFDSGLIYAKQDVFFNTCKITLSDHEDSDNVIIKDSYFVIKSDTIFRENNSIVTIATDDELSYLENLSSTGLQEFLLENKFFYNPYYYVLDLSDTQYTDCRVYDLDRPEISSNRIINKNMNVNPSVNISQYAITKETYGYRILLTLTSNTEFNNLNVQTVKLQMKIPLYGGTNYAYIDSNYLEESGYYEFKIQTDSIIDEDGYYTLNNGYSTLATKKFSLEEDLLIYTMSSDSSVVDTSLFLYDEVYISDTTTVWVIFTKESLSTVFGKQLKYLYTNVYNTYTDRKYKTYDYDVPKTYSENVYKTDPTTGSPFVCSNPNEEEVDGEQHNVYYEVLYYAGEQVKDDDGNLVYAYLKGDNILDENGDPIVDTSAGICRYIDILMLEYEFKLANSTAYTTYNTTVLDTLDEMINTDLADINDDMLENTEVLYKSYKSARPVKVDINTSTVSLSYFVTPSVTLYLNNTTSTTSLQQETYKNTIGKIISSYLDNSTIKLEDIRNDIKETLGDIVSSVKITGLDTDNSEILTMTNDNYKLSLNKQLTVNTNNEYIVKYNIDLEIIYI